MDRKRVKRIVNLTPEDEKNIVNLYNSGVLRIRIMEKYKIGVDRLNGVLKNHGVIVQFAKSRSNVSESHHQTQYCTACNKTFLHCICDEHIKKDNYMSKRYMLTGKK